jgi:hypothetical protein
VSAQGGRGLGEGQLRALLFSAHCAGTHPTLTRLFFPSFSPLGHFPRHPRASFYVLEGPPKGSLIEDLCEASRLRSAQCEHLRIPAWEYALKVRKGKGRLKEHLKAKERDK